MAGQIVYMCAYVLAIFSRQLLFIVGTVFYSRGQLLYRGGEGGKEKNFTLSELTGREKEESEEREVRRRVKGKWAKGEERGKGKGKRSRCKYCSSWERRKGNRKREWGNRKETGERIF